MPATAEDGKTKGTRNAARRGAAIWFTGLPGSGKSALAKAVQKALAERSVPAIHLQMDARRKAYFPNPEYTDAERDAAYRLFAEEAASLIDKGHIVLMDGSAPRLSMRRYARGLIGAFAEAHVKCSLSTAMRRESARPEGMVMAGLYAKAIKRKATGEQFEGLGEVIGVDVPFEEDPNAEAVVDAERLSPEQAAKEVLRTLSWLLFSPIAP